MKWLGLLLGMGVVAVVCFVAPLDIAVPGVVDSGVVEPEIMKVEMFLIGYR